MHGAESALLSTLREMLGLPQYLFPLAAAQRQYRLHYYGLSSAALLEDLFHDALANYLAQYRPEIQFERPDRGQKGWDYCFAGMPVSHKVGLKPQPIAALWDATVKADRWSFESPVVYVCAGYSPATGTITSPSGASRRIRAVSGAPEEEIKSGSRLWLVRWPDTGAAEVVWSRQATTTTTVGELASFDALWPAVASHLRQGFPANELELFRSTSRDPDALGVAAQDPAGWRIEFELRSGVYFFPRASLQDVPVTSNNRALLISGDTVRSKMIEAAGAGACVPMPLWFALYAATRPPDLFLSQQAEYEGMFSPARRVPTRPGSPMENNLSHLF